MSKVTFAVLNYEVNELGLKVVFRLSNRSDNDVCLFAPPTISLVAGLFDRRNGYLVRDWLEGDDLSGALGSEGAGSAKRGRTVVPSNDHFDFDWVVLPVKEPVLVDSANIPVEGMVNMAALSIVSDVTLTDCEFDQPDEAMRLGRFQTLKAKSFKLKGNLDPLFPD